MSNSSVSTGARPASAPPHSGTVDAPLPPALALCVNEVCDRFEAAWKGIAAGAPGQREAGLALWHGGDDYLILHNVACIYAVLSGAEPGQARQHQDMAMRLLQRAVDLCRRAGDRDKEVWNIQGDSSLAVLSSHQGYKKLIGEARP